MTSSKIKRFLLTEIAADIGKQSLRVDENLLEQSIIDSLGILKLVSFLEETYGIQIIDQDIIPENFQSINAIIGFIEQKTRRWHWMRRASLCFRPERTT